MATIGRNELPEAARTMLDQGEALDVTDQGKVVARIVPVPERGVRSGLLDDLDATDAFAAEVSAAWKDGMSAVEAVDEQRRQL